MFLSCQTDIQHRLIYGYRETWLCLYESISYLGIVILVVSRHFELIIDFYYWITQCLTTIDDLWIHPSDYCIEIEL